MIPPTVTSFCVGVGFGVVLGIAGTMLWAMATASCDNYDTRDR